MRRSLAVAVLTALLAVTVLPGCGHETVASSQDLLGVWQMTSNQEIFSTSPREVTLKITDPRPADEGARIQSNVAGCPARWADSYEVSDGRLRLGPPAAIPAIGCLGEVSRQSAELSRFLEAAPDARRHADELVLRHGRQQLVLQRVER